MTDRMVVWLREAMDAAQADAEAATPGPWTAHPDDEEIRAADDTVARMRDYTRVMTNAQVEADMALIVTRADPAAVLRRIAADRKILDLHKPTRGDAWDGSKTVCDTCANASREEIEGEPYPCATLRLLAEGYGWTEGLK